MSYYPGQRQASRALTYLILFVIGIGLTVGLYYVKTRAQSAKKEAARLERSYASEKAALNVLKAELAYLTGPERTGELARAELGLVPVKTKQVIPLNEIESRFELTQPLQGAQP